MAYSSDTDTDISGVLVKTYLRSATSKAGKPYKALMLDFGQFEKMVFLTDAELALVELLSGKIDGSTVKK